jgi:ABC-type transport system involved in multi-copper enzyme maturation permease subunit
MQRISLNSFRWQTNPIIVKELRSRMRGGRAFATLTTVLVFLSAFIYALYRILLVTMRFSSTPLSPQIGQTMFGGLVFLELIVISAIAPALTSGAISTEKEKLTYEMLLATPLHPVKVLWGKLVSALSYVFLLIFAVVPMVSLVFVFGGVSMRDMAKALVILVSVAILFGVIGLFMSTLFGRTGRATILTYLVVVTIMFGPLFISFITGVMRQAEPPRWFMIPSPIAALASAISPSLNPQVLSSSLWMFGSFYWSMFSPPISITSVPRPIYHYCLPIYGAITLLLYLLTTRLVRPARRWRINWAESLVAIVLILGYTGLVMFTFYATSGRYENVKTITDPNTLPVRIEPYPEPGFNNVPALQPTQPAQDRSSQEAYPPPEVAPASSTFPSNNERIYTVNYAQS